jgi:hypothetical protein
MRSSRFFVVAVLSLSTVASADLKIKTRTTVMGHTTESTVYIKGPRQRTEMSVGRGGGTASILQCDQHRMINVMGEQCMVMPFGGGETSCPAMPNARDLMRGMTGKEPEPPRKGGVVTIMRKSTDTGERQDMFGYKARHVRSVMMMESSPDACNQSNMKMEMDGWYADLSPGFSCGEESYRSMACGGMRGGRACNDRIVMKGGGEMPLGYPLKQTVTMTSKDGNYTMTQEVVELTNASLDAPLFDMPPGCRVMDMGAMAGAAPAPAHTEPAPTPGASAAASPSPAKPAGAPAPAVAPKSAGVTRVGVVKIDDKSGEALPTNNLRLNLMSEFGRHQLEAIPLDAESPQADVEAEAKGKQCDYIVYTVPSQVKQPGSGGITPASLPKGAKLDPAKVQALTLVTLYKVGAPAPELKNVPVPGEAPALTVDAVMETFVQEADLVAKQVADDAHPKPATAKPATKPKPAPTRKPQ